MTPKKLLQDFIRNKKLLHEEYQKIINPQEQGEIDYYLILQETHKNILKQMEEEYDK